MAAITALPTRHQPRTIAQNQQWHRDTQKKNTKHHKKRKINRKQQKNKKTTNQKPEKSENTKRKQTKMWDRILDDSARLTTPGPWVNRRVA
jgi:hypothetical protein